MDVNVSIVFNFRLQAVYFISELSSNPHNLLTETQQLPRKQPSMVRPSILSFLCRTHNCNSQLYPTHPALLVYEYLLTLSQEIDYIWHRKTSITTVLFLVNRYSIVFVRAFNIVQLVSWGAAPGRNADTVSVVQTRTSYFSNIGTYMGATMKLGVESSPPRWLSCTLNHPPSISRCTVLSRLVEVSSIILYVSVARKSIPFPTRIPHIVHLELTHPRTDSILRTPSIRHHEQESHTTNMRFVPRTGVSHR